ncbi:MAG TPA: hypothetical protein VM840_01915 [Actinomycetota bacterium]|nr:hypothetical protein [Actinomycetota bacterium]
MRRTQSDRGAAITAACLFGWVALLVAAHLRGRALLAAGERLFLGFPPLHATWEPRVTLLVLAPIAVAAAVIVWGPDLASRARWTHLMYASWGAAAAWAVALAATDGWTALTTPLTHPTEYLRVVPGISDPLRFLRTFTERIGAYPTHVQGHPPGFVLLLWLLDSVGLSGPGPAAAVLIAAGASAVPAVALAARDLAGEDQARRALPFLVLVPAAVWVATSADALFMALAAWGFSCFVRAALRPGGEGDVLAAGSGLAFGTGLFMTYGMAPFGLSVIAVAGVLRRVRPLLVGGAAVGAVAVAFLAGGFWWYDGLQATVVRYVAGAGGTRPDSYFWWANLAAFAVAVGPAAVAGAARLRDLRLWLPLAAVLLAVCAATASGMSKAEVERIWLPFVPWTVLACVSLWTGKAAVRAWLAGQAAVALAVQLLLRSPW